MKPKLFYVDSTTNSITLKWEVEDGFDDMIYRIDVKDKAYSWITKYWGKQTQCEVKGLGPETLYYFRLGVSRELVSEEFFSNILTTATKDAPPMVFYLFKAAERNDIHSLESFLKERKDSAAIDAFDNKGETALIRAVGKNNMSAVRRLLVAKASVNQGGYGTGRTPLMHACYMGFYDIANLLIEYGANINSSDCNNCTPLHYAVDWNHVELIKLCLQSGADINKKDSVGWTPLMRAVILGSSEGVVNELISNKPDLNLKDRNGKTVLDIAKLENKLTIYELLKENYINQSDKEEDIQNPNEGCISKTVVNENKEIEKDEDHQDIVQEEVAPNEDIEEEPKQVDSGEEKLDIINVDII